MQKMPFYLAICGLLEINKKTTKNHYAACGTIGQRSC